MARTDEPVVRAAGAGAAGWNDLVRASPDATVFHLREALSVVADHAGADCHRLVGYDDGEPVGVFPVFVLRKGPLTAAFSPPPGMGLPALGPATLAADGSPASRPGALVAACHRWLDDRVDPSYVHVLTPPGSAGGHPLAWGDGAEVSPRFTYVVDLTVGREALLASFSSDARRNVRDGDDRVTVAEGGLATVDRVVDQLRDRYADQGLAYPVEAAFVRDLHDRLPDGVVRPYACRVDGEFVGGMVSLWFGDAVYRWQGGAAPTAGPPVNDLLDWRLMTDALAAGLARYDLVGANTDRLCSYKAKFNPGLATYFSVERGSRGMDVVAALYRRLRETGLHPKATLF